MKHPHSTNLMASSPVVDSIRRLLFGGPLKLDNIPPNSSLASSTWHWNINNSAENNAASGFGQQMCACLSQLEQICTGQVPFPQCPLLRREYRIIHSEMTNKHRQQ
jgi:hypothetical protein